VARTPGRLGCGEERRNGLSLGTTLLALYVLLVGVGLVILFLAPAERMRLPVYVVSALIIALAALFVVGFSWLLLAALSPS
jgi:hypothetical protein